MMKQVTNTLESAKMSDDCIDKFRELNSCLKPKWRFIVFRLSDDESCINVHHCEPVSNESILIVHKQLLSYLPEQDPCWIAYNFPYYVTNGGKRNKVAIINWIPDTLKRESLKESARIKMMSVTYNGLVKKTLRGAVCFIQSNSPDDIEFSTVLTKVAKNEREPIDHERTQR